MSGFTRYFAKKVVWYLATFVVALVLNFLLPRLIPGNPVMIILSKMSEGMTDTDKYTAIYNEFYRSFGLDQPLWKQFFSYVNNVLHGDLGKSFLYYPRSVSSLIASALPYTLAIQLPSILIGWILGNTLGAVAAYKRGLFDRTVFPVSLLLSSIPSFIFSFIMLFVFGVLLGWAPLNGAYAANMIPSFVQLGFLKLPSWAYFSSLLQHWALPFVSTSLVMIGTQAIGMRSMSLYELNSDYVLNAKLGGIPDRMIIRYVFRNAMLPQITGLALSLGSMVSGALIVEVVFSYPGVGSILFAAIRNVDYTLLSGCTLMITITVLISNFLIDMLYGLIDPRVRSAQTEEA